MITIKLIEKKQRIFHNDLHIIIEELGIDRCVDTYYFALDSQTYPEHENYAKVKLVLVMLLSAWERSLQNLHESENTFLPFDFSDEYTGGLSVRRQGTSFIVNYMVYRMYGGMNPSCYSLSDLLDKEPYIKSETAEFDTAAFLAEIRAQREKVK